MAKKDAARLLAKLERLEIGGAAAGGEDGFAARLAEDLLWTEQETHAALGEYRRFLALAATSDAALTPSHAVDLVWRAHLGESRDYWERWAEALGQPPHRAAGGADAEAAATSYARSLALYETAFGPPPTAQWPAEGHRFDPMDETVRTPLRAALDTHAAASRWRWLAFGFLSAGLMGVFASAARPGSESVAAWIALVLGLIASLAAGKMIRSGRPGDPKRAAWLLERSARLGRPPRSDP